MPDNSIVPDSVMPSRRVLLALAAGGALVPTIGAGSALAQADSVEPRKATDAVDPFRVSVSQAAIDDLRRRLAATRWPDRETVGDWSQGVPLDKAHALVAYWRDKYDWRRFEARANTFPHFRTRIDGLGIHFLHAPSQHPKALPI